MSRRHYQLAVHASSSRRRPVSPNRRRQAPAAQPQRPPQPPLGPNQWRIDTGHSAANFSVRHNVVSTVRGQLGRSAARSSTTARTSRSVKADVTIDVNGINTQNERRDNHLRSPDFFDVANHPAVHVQVEARGAGADGEFKLIGDLTIRDKTKEVVLDVEGPSPIIKSQRGIVTGATATTGQASRVRPSECSGTR